MLLMKFFGTIGLLNVVLCSMATDTKSRHSNGSNEHDNVFIRESNTAKSYVKPWRRVPKWEGNTPLQIPSYKELERGGINNSGTSRITEIDRTASTEAAKQELKMWKSSNAATIVYNANFYAEVTIKEERIVIDSSQERTTDHNMLFSLYYVSGRKLYSIPIDTKISFSANPGDSQVIVLQGNTHNLLEMLEDEKNQQATVMLRIVIKSN